VLSVGCIAYAHEVVPCMQFKRWGPRIELLTPHPLSSLWTRLQAQLQVAQPSLHDATIERNLVGHTVHAAVVTVTSRCVCAVCPCRQLLSPPTQHSVYPAGAAVNNAAAAVQLAQDCHGPQRTLHLTDRKMAGIPHASYTPRIQSIATS
jgi:hypothetical protein